MVSWNKTGACSDDKYKLSLVGFIRSKNVRGLGCSFNQVCLLMVCPLMCNTVFQVFPFKPFI